MKWSFSKSKIFLTCQRKWFFNEYVARWNAKDDFRKEAHTLKQLYSRFAWRGKIVDDIIEKKIVPELSINNLPDFEDIERNVEELIKKQYNYAKSKRYRKDGETKQKAGENFCALKEIEFEKGISENDLYLVKEDIFNSLNNLLQSKLIKEIKGESCQLFSQKRLNFKFNNDVNIVCIPDLIVIYKEHPPLIIDWKVHQFANSEARMQLFTYAYVYYNVSEDNPNLNKIEDIKLIEYQLLKNYLWEYSINPEDILETEDHIFDTSSEMKNLIRDRSYDQINLSELKTATSPRVCYNCNFKKLYTPNLNSSLS